MRHFVVTLHFRVPFETFGETVPRHRAFLQEGYDRGLLLMSGPQSSRTGGIVIARAESLESIQEFFLGDPYLSEGLASHVFTEFTPVKSQELLKEWLG
jgi:uncharacterized protein YciI